jgi:hypothetical protein
MLFFQLICLDVGQIELLWFIAMALLLGLFESGASGFYGCGPSVRPYLAACECFVQCVRIVAMLRIEVQVVDVEARRESFSYCCGGSGGMRVGSSNTTNMHRPTKRT